MTLSLPNRWHKINNSVESRLGLKLTWPKINKIDWKAYLLLIMGMLIKLAPQTAANGTNRAYIGFMFWKRNMIVYFRMA